MGFDTFGFGGGRADVWEPEEDIYWGPEDAWLGDERYSGDRELANTFGAVRDGSDLRESRGAQRRPDRACRRQGHPGDVRSHGHERRGDRRPHRRRAHLGKTHGATDRTSPSVTNPKAASIEEQGLGWKNTFGSGKAGDTITSGLEGAWTRPR